METAGDNALIKSSIDALTDTQGFDLSNFTSALYTFMGLLDEYAYTCYCSEEKGGGEEYSLKKGMQLKKDWMQKYAKSQLAEFKYKENAGVGNPVRRRVQHTLGDYSVEDRIGQAFNDVLDVLDELRDVEAREENNRSERAKTTLLLRRLKTKGGLPLLVALVNNTNDKRETSDVSLRLRRMGEKLLEQLEQGLQAYLPSQSTGYPIAKASFNLYTINKRPINYNGRIVGINSQMEVTNLSSRLNGFANKEQKERIKADIEKKAEKKTLLLGENPFMETDKYASLRQILKNILAEQKAKFNEFVQKGGSYEDLQKSDLYLFSYIDKNEFEDYKRYTEDIVEKATEYNQTKFNYNKKSLRSDLITLKKERGELISAACRKTNNKFKTYKQFADLYRKVAQQHGRLFAQLKGIETERSESQMINYWALILQRGNRHQLILIPKEKASKCKIRLKQEMDKESETRLFWFESFTFKSLQKLCFSNTENGSNKFYLDLKKELGYKYHSEKGGFISGEFEFRGDEQKKIAFYKDVLNSNLAKRVLNLPQEEVQQSIMNASFESLSDFKLALEQICYKRMYTVNPYIVGALQSEFSAQVFDISSLDLRHEESCEGKKTIYAYKDKKHTEIWKRFRSAKNEENNFDVRLCPQITIMYRKPKESRVHKYGKDSDKYDETQRNRYLHEQLTLVARFTEQSNSPDRELAFLPEEEEKKIVEDFNVKVRKENIRYAFGIDNGEVELSTLGVYLPEFAKGSYEEIMAQLRRVDDFGFPALTIKDLNYKERDLSGKDRRVVQNPSYFIDESLYCRTFGKSKQQYVEMFSKLFEKKNLLTLDLSTAKVIGGHIVTNGDVVSLFKLWMRHAQRNIYNMNEHQNKQGSRLITLKRSKDLNDEERRKFMDYLNEGNQSYERLSKKNKSLYVKWVYNCWDGKEEPNLAFEKVYNDCKRKGNFLEIVLCAVCFNGEDIESVVAIFDVRNVFKLRSDFYCIESEEEILKDLNDYNVRVISDEELDLKLKQTKSSLVANVIGVIDFLYRDYQKRFGGEGIIVQEGLGVSSVEQALEKFSGNIYRLLERRLYQKFQSKGLVPPIKNLLLFREKNVVENGNGRNDFLQIGNICFVDPSGTSQNALSAKMVSWDTAKSVRNTAVLKAAA